MKSTIYFKQDNEHVVPVTVRIEWLPNGKIKPLMYWTPDNSCYAVLHVFESIPLAFLKDRGEGIRFKIKSVMTESLEYDAGFSQSIDEIYLYFADGRFCEKDFIAGRYGHASKEYVPVTMDIFPNGDYELVYFRVGENRYMVEKTIEIEPHGSFLAGGIGIRHKVETRLVNSDNDDDPIPYKSFRRLTALYWELDKWFVAVNAA